MDQTELDQICAEAQDNFAGRLIGRFFQLGQRSFAIDFIPHSGAYLFVDFSSRHSSTFLIQRRRRELERESRGPIQLLLTLQRELQGCEVTRVSCVNGQALVVEAAADGTPAGKLVIKVVGPAPNVYLLNGTDGLVASAWHEDPVSDFIQSLSGEKGAPGTVVRSSVSLSERMDAEYQAITSAERLAEKAALARKKIQSEIAKRTKLIANLRADLERHGNAEEWKRFGDLVLANLGQLRREGDSIFVTDYYDPELSEVEIKGEHNLEPTEVANVYFKRYSKARNAQQVVQERLTSTERELADLDRKRLNLEAAIERSDEDAIAEYLRTRSDKPETGQKKKAVGPVAIKGVRRFLSSDGFEIWVGKKAADNDVLTFRLAKSLEYWLHAADYPGSHVIIRNPGRKDVPERTLVQAAELAAFYSDGRSQVKANVRYALRKFVHKPKRSAPGMVSLSSFKTIYVEPRITVENLDVKK